MATVPEGLRSDCWSYYAATFSAYFNRFDQCFDFACVLKVYAQRICYSMRQPRVFLCITCLLSIEVRLVWMSRISMASTGCTHHYSVYVCSRAYNKQLKFSLCHVSSWNNLFIQNFQLTQFNLFTVDLISNSLLNSKTYFSGWWAFQPCLVI